MTDGTASEDPWEGAVPPMPGEEEKPKTGWEFFDLKSVLDGTYKAPQPTVGCRDDGVGLFYPGKVNTIAGESESGKTWLALLGCVTEINRGNHVVYLDFEDDAGGVVTRLLVLGAHPDDVLDRFHYVRPESSPMLTDLDSFMATVTTVMPTLAVLDGVTEAMSMLGLELKDNTDIAKFGRHLLRPFVKLNAAMVTLDHVVKSAENRGRYSIGGVHKVNGLNGVMYVVEPIHPFGIGLTGRSRVRISKDRPAQIRRHALPGSNGALHWYGDLVVKSHDETFAEAHLYPPNHRPEGPADETAEKEQQDKTEAEIEARKPKILAVLKKAKDPLTMNEVTDLVPGRASVTRRAMTRLIHDDVVAAQQGPNRSTLHSLPEKDGGEP